MARREYQKPNVYRKVPSSEEHRRTESHGQRMMHYRASSRTNLSGGHRVEDQKKRSTPTVWDLARLPCHDQFSTT